MPYLKLKDIESKEIVKGYRAGFFHSGNMTIAYREVEAGAELPMHSHPHEQVSTIVEGNFKFNFDGNIKIIDTFYPER